MIGLFCLATGLLGQWLLGLFIAEKVLSVHNRNQLSKVELSGLAGVLGIGATSWILFVASFCGIPLISLTSWILTIAGYLSGGPILLIWLRQHHDAHCCRSIETATEQQMTAVCRGCQFLIAILFAMCLMQTLQTPQKLWDERAIFAIKARVLFEDGSIRSPALMHPDFVQYHPRYPLLLPLAEEHVYALMGTVDDRLSKVIFTVLFCGMIITAAGVLSRHLLRSRAWLGAVILATVPVMMPYEYGFLCGQADAPVACYHGLSVLYLWDGLQHQRRGDTNSGAFLIAGICGGMAAFTKDEGIAYLMIDTSIMGLFAMGFLSNHSRLWSSLKGIILFLAATAAVIAPWFVHRRSLPLTTEMNYFGRMTTTLFVSRLDTLSWSVPHLLRRMFWEWREWGLQWWLMVAALVSRPSRAITIPQLLLVLDVAGALTSLLAAGMLAPAQLDEHIGGSSHRFLMQITPVAVLFAITMFPNIEEHSDAIKSTD